jgi:hypothetical protein
MTRRNGRYGRKYNRLGIGGGGQRPFGIDLGVTAAFAFGNIVSILGSDLNLLPQPSNGFFLVRIEMASGHTSSGSMESLSHTNSKIRMRLRQDITEWREDGPGTPLVTVKNMRRIVAISPIDSIDVKIDHPGSTFEPAPGGMGISPGRRLKSNSGRRKGLRSRSRRRR